MVTKRAVQSIQRIILFLLGLACLLCPILFSVPHRGRLEVPESRRKLSPPTSRNFAETVRMTLDRWTSRSGAADVGAILPGDASRD